MKLSSIPEKVLFAKIELWAVLVLVIFLFVIFPVFGFLLLQKTAGRTDHPLAEAAYEIAAFPALVTLVFSGDLDELIQPQRLAFDSFSGLKVFRNGFEETGTLLLSAYDDAKGISTARLVELSSQRVLHEWVPPVEAINAQTTNPDPQNERQNFATQHPLLLDDGGLILSSGEGPLARIDACGNLEWTIDRHFHHSIEVGPEGDFYAPHVIPGSDDPIFTRIEGVDLPIRDDGFARVSPDGKILREWSIKGILERNGYTGLLYGVGKFETDRTHLNDVQPILETDDYVRKGDLVLSIRNLSTVFLYRPSSDEIIWLKTGPWLKQHDVDYHGDGVFTIFGNGSIDFRDMGDIALYEHSAIWRYDQKVDKVTPFLPLKKADIYTATQGLHRVLDYARRDVFVEEQNEGLLHRVDEDGLIWSFADGQGDGRIGITHWSRYLTRDEAEFPWLAGLECE